ncbi:MAG: ribbon-helix-helix protein, CopG family [Oscillospiraceae bacterium]|nr:ribbon-helix-helix protein, CopG family [Oscillospiraceae bacterium]
MSGFIPKPYKKEPIAIRIDVEKLELIERLARKYDTNRSEFINRCIDFAIENMTDRDEDV